MEECWRWQSLLDDIGYYEQANCIKCPKIVLAQAGNNLSHEKKTSQLDEFKVHLTPLLPPSSWLTYEDTIVCCIRFISTTTINNNHSSNSNT